MASHFDEMWYTTSEQPQNMTVMNAINKKPEPGNKFHWLFLQGERTTAAAYDTIVKETEHFVVMPTKGSIVPGWLLVVPKFPITRMADVPAELRDELGQLVSRMSLRLSTRFGDPYIFEHGGFEGSKVSCGVDQAHLHIASLDFDLIEAAKNESNSGWVEVMPGLPKKEEIGRDEYWFVSNGKVSKCKVVDKPSSQFFRKVIARKVGVSERWDYRTDDFIENVQSTLAAVGANG